MTPEDDQALAAAFAELRQEEEGQAPPFDEVVRLNRGRDGFYHVLRLEHPFATTERELAARYLIAKVAERFHDDPSRRAEATGRLEAEYQGLK